MNNRWIDESVYQWDTNLITGHYDDGGDRTQFRGHSFDFTPDSDLYVATERASRPDVVMDTWSTCYKMPRLGTLAGSLSGGHFGEVAASSAATGISSTGSIVTVTVAGSQSPSTSQIS